MPPHPRPAATTSGAATANYRSTAELSDEDRIALRAGTQNLDHGLDELVQRIIDDWDTLNALERVASLSVIAESLIHENRCRLDELGTRNGPGN
jgi:hypothetical protein